MRSSRSCPIGFFANALITAVRMPKQRRSPRATLYSPPPSHTRKFRAVWMRSSPGSSRSITSPRLTQSHLQFSAAFNTIESMQHSSWLAAETPLAGQRCETRSAYNRPSGATYNLKIIRLKTAVVGGNFDWTFVRIETDEGIRGLGECFFAPGLTSILRSLEPLLIGEDPRDIHRLFRKLQMATSGAGSVAGIIYNAISGIEAALWDVLGQWLEVPIYRLLGGKFRDRVRIYADCHGGEALESLEEGLRSRPASW